MLKQITRYFEILLLKMVMAELAEKNDSGLKRNSNKPHYIIL